MPSNNSGARVGYLAARYPGRIAHLYSPGGQRGPWEFLPYALDNGAFKGFDEEEWLKLLDWAKLSGIKPLWAIVPDVVGDRAATLRQWSKYAPVLRPFNWPLAFAVQDGMTPRDVPTDAEVVFVGGSTEWKWKTFGLWCSTFPRVHIGRVNSYRRLWDCHDAGAESVDGTGFFRGRQPQFRGLMAYLEETSGERARAVQLDFDSCLA